MDIAIDLCITTKDALYNLCSDDIQEPLNPRIPASRRIISALTKKGPTVLDDIDWAVANFLLYRQIDYLRWEEKEGTTVDFNLRRELDALTHDYAEIERQLRIAEERET